MMMKLSVVDIIIHFILSESENMLIYKFVQSMLFIEMPAFVFVQPGYITIKLQFTWLIKFSLSWLPSPEPHSEFL